MIAKDQPEAGERGPGDTIYLDTATRATMSLAAQMGLYEQLAVRSGLDRDNDPFNDARYEGYCKQLQVAEKKRDLACRNWIILDALVIVLSLGQSLQIPGGISLNQFPAAIEITTFLSVLAFYFSVTTFFDWHIYNMLVDRFNIRKVSYSGIDPDFLGASDKFYQFNLKFALPKLNIWGKDFFIPGAGAKRFYVFNGVLMALMVLCVPLYHFLATYLGLASCMGRIDPPYNYIYAAIIVTLNLLTVTLIVGHAKSWKYTMVDYIPPIPKSPFASHIHQPDL